eukprot:gene17085-12224_t
MDEVKARLDRLQEDAKAKVRENRNTIVERGDQFYKSFTRTNPEPVFIAGTVGIGTARVRANHIDAIIHYYEEQEKLKSAGAPI